MPNLVNEMLCKEYTERYRGVENLVAIGYEGLDVQRTNQLRGELEKQEVHLDLVKSRIARIAFKELGRADIQPLCQGQTALAYGEDPVAVARFLVDYRKANKEMKIHGALVEDTILDEARTVDLSKSPTKEELKGIIAGQALSPGAKVAGALMGPARTLAGQVKALIEKKEEEGGE